VLGQAIVGRLLRRSPEATVVGLLSLCCADASRVHPDVVALHVAVARKREAFTDVDRGTAAAMRSVIAIAGLGSGQAYRRGIRSITCPVVLLHGDRDRLVPVTVARSAAPTRPGRWSCCPAWGTCLSSKRRRRPPRRSGLARLRRPRRSEIGYPGPPRGVSWRAGQPPAGALVAPAPAWRQALSRAANVGPGPTRLGPYRMPAMGSRNAAGADGGTAGVRGSTGVTRR
jgi:hypothetical protein